MGKCGVYYIQNKITKQLYIGQSKNLKIRKRKHFSMLRNNSHFNKYLQRSFNKYGEKNFEFKVIEYCEPSQLDKLEIAYINFYNLKEHGFNIKDGGEALPDNRGENNGMYGATAPNRRYDIDNCLDDICKEYEYGVPITMIAEQWGTARKIIREKLRTVYSKEEMEAINNRNLNKALYPRKSFTGHHGIESRINMSKSHNTSGYFRVSYDSYGESWIYKYYDENKKRRKISAKTIEKLEQKVKSKGLEWIKY